MFRWCLVIVRWVSRRRGRKWGEWAYLVQLGAGGAWRDSAIARLDKVHHRVRLAARVVAVRRAALVHHLIER